MSEEEYVGTLVFDYGTAIPSIDMGQPIVRCRDCEYYETDELGDCCTLMDFEDVKGMADRFCAWGKRRGDA